MNERTDHDSTELDFDDESLLHFSVESTPLVSTSPATPPAATPRTRYLPMQGRERQLQTAMNARLQQMLEQNPEYRQFSVKLAITVRPKAKPGGSHVLKAIIRRILSPTGARETQTAIRTAVQAEFPEHGAYKDWTRPLPQWARKYAETVISNSRGALRDIQVKKSTTLSELHRLARYAALTSDGGNIGINVTLTLSNDCLSINGKQFSISDNKSGGKVYRIARINVDHLKLALSNR